MIDKDIVRLCIAAGGGALVAGGAIFTVIGLRRRLMRWKGKKPKMTLYHCYPARSSRCAWLIAELDVEKDFHIVPVNCDNGAEMSGYRASVHPHGTLPALVIEDGYTLLESGGICMYLADLYGDLLPSLSERQLYYDWIVYVTSTLDPVLDTLSKQHMLDKEQRETSLIKENRNAFSAGAQRLSHLLKKQDYICNNRFTAADCVVGYAMEWASVISEGELLTDYPYILSYMERLERRPAFQKVCKRND